MNLAGEPSCDDPAMLRSDTAKAAALLAEVSEATQDRHERQLVDAHTCLEVFVSNWQQALNIMESSDGVNEDDVDPAFAYLGQMMTLLGEERAQEDGQPGSILAYACKADIFNRMLSWTTDRCQGNGRMVERIKLQLLSLYELLVMNQSRQALLFSQASPRSSHLPLCRERNSRNSGVEPGSAGCDAKRAFNPRATPNRQKKDDGMQM